MSISYNGYDTKYLTAYGPNVTVGSLVNFDINNNLVNAKNGEPFIGLAVAKRDNIVSVQERGYVEVKYDGQKPVHGYCNFVAANNNAVKTDMVAGLYAYKVLKIDENNGTVGFIL